MTPKLTAAQLHKIQTIQKNLQLVHLEAVLGTSDGRVEDELSHGEKVYVRYTTANSVGWPQSVRRPIVKVAMVPGTPVWVGFDNDGELAVTGPRVGAQVQVGQNPITNDVQNDPTGGFVDLARSLPLLSYPSSPPSLSIKVKSLWYVLDGTAVIFPSGAADLTSLVPGTANKQCLALVYLDTNDNALHAVASTPISVAGGSGAFSVGDIQECVTAAGDTAIYSKFWWLTHGMTKIGDAQSYLDFRLWLGPIVTSGGGSGEDLIARKRSWFGI